MKIVLHPHPALRFPARPIVTINESLRDVVRGMFTLMYEANGIGLAANQVGLPYQLFILNLTGDPDEPEEEQVFINPSILRKQSQSRQEEGCLSFPGLYGNVFRPKKIRVRALDLEGRPFETDADDLYGRAVQHEFDHLHGRLFIDLLSPLGKISAGKKIADIEALFRASQDAGDYPPDDVIQRQLEDLARRSPVVVPANANAGAGGITASS